VYAGSEHPHTAQVKASQWKCTEELMQQEKEKQQ
jgi:hypothetical protein